MPSAWPAEPGSVTPDAPPGVTAVSRAAGAVSLVLPSRCAMSLSGFAACFATHHQPRKKAIRDRYGSQALPQVFLRRCVTVARMATTELSLALLGPPVVRRDGTPVTFDTRKATALLALTGREHSREQLADLLWPDADSARGRASLRRTLSVTAAEMGDGLLISRSAVALEPAVVQVDVSEFETLIAQPDAASLERAAQLYRDDFLAGFTLRDCPDFEEWHASVSEGLRQSLARGLQRLVAACIADG